MSLLMDALRKAEEAKKQAAQEAKSEEAVPVAVVEKQQADVAAEEASEDSPASEIKLSMEVMEEVNQRSAVPNLETSIEFEDEEDYVLPTSLGSAKESAGESDSVIEQSPSSENKAEPEAPVGPLEIDLGEPLATPEPESEPALEKLPRSVAMHEALDFDSFESEEAELADSEEAAAPDPVTPATSGSKESGKMQGSRMTVKVAEQARERAREKAAPGRRSAQNVFAAKRSPLLRNRNMRAAAGGALALVVVAFGTYFYISLNQESTFNIPVGSYVATEFVDDGIVLGADGEALSIDAVTVADPEETVVINVADNTLPEQLVTTGNVNTSISNISAAPSVADTLIEPPAPEVIALPLPEPSRNGANLQPETISVDTPQLEAVATTIGDAPAAEAEVIVEVVQPVAISNVESVAPAEPTQLISFRKQQTITTVDPRVDRAYGAYQQGSLDEAEVLYRQTLASDPTQRDALLGLATIAARNGNSTEALDLYSRLLARNPNDPIARAGLMEILPAGSPSEQEAELKRLLNDHPSVAALSYAYGNFLGSNQRWSEAQQAYFRALQLAKSDAAINGLVNPDYAFNLAVSLEHLNQSKPAQNYYREALEYSANHPAGFDLAAVRSRLASMLGSGNDE